MGKQHSQHPRNRRERSKDCRIRPCYCRPCFVVSSLFKGIGRCMFVICFPVIQCFGCDDYSHRHHHHHHKHFF